MGFTIRTVCREYSSLINKGAKGDTMIELKLAICKDGKTVFKSYKIKGKLELKHWNPDLGQVRKGCMYADELNILIKDTEVEYTQVGLSWETVKRDFTSGELINYQKAAASKESLFEYIEHLIDLFKKRGTGNFNMYRNLLGEMHSFTKNRNVKMSDINNKFLFEYIKWCLAGGNDSKTVLNKFYRLKSVVKKAKNDGISVSDITLTYTPTKKPIIKRGLSESNVQKLLAYKPRKKKWEFVMDMFKFMYYSAGISFRDMAFLTQDNISDNHLSYIRFKTHKPINIPLPEISMMIIDKYKFSKDRGKYLFPIIPLKRQHLDYIELYTYINSRIFGYNTLLDKIGKELDLPIKLTSYVARHSYATQLLRSGIPLPMISKALGHSTIQMTQNYLNLNDFDLTVTFDCLTPKLKEEKLDGIGMAFMNHLKSNPDWEKYWSMVTKEGEVLPNKATLVYSGNRGWQYILPLVDKKELKGVVIFPVKEKPGSSLLSGEITEPLVFFQDEMEKDISVQGLLRSPMRIEWEYDVNITSAMSLETVTKSPLSCSGYDGYYDASYVLVCSNTIDCSGNKALNEIDMDYLQYVADKIGCQFSCKVKVKNDVIIVEGQREREVCFFYNSLREELEKGLWYISYNYLWNDCEKQAYGENSFDS